jgi:hypothetical protein
VDCFEDWQFTNSGLIGIYEIFLALAVLIKALHGVKLCYIEVASDLADVAVLVSEHAAAPIVALLFLVEGSAIFCSLPFFCIRSCFEGC